jgi:hypothetical protein
MFGETQNYYRGDDADGGRKNPSDAEAESLGEEVSLEERVSGLRSYNHLPYQLRHLGFAD